MSILFLHILSTWFMIGLIWTIQVVHYPLFAHVGDSSFRAFEDDHTVRMGRLLAVPASIEVATGGLLVWMSPEALSLSLVLVGGSILVALWVMTLFVHVRLHKTLSAQRSEPAIARLVSANWYRTAGWSLRGLLVIVMLGQVI